MRRILVPILGAVLIITAPTLSAAQQRGGARGGGTPPASGPAQRGPQTGAPRHPQIRAGVESAQRVQDRARDLEKHASGGGSLKTMLRDRDRLRTRLREMEQAHDRWRNGLAEPDRLRLQDQLREMDQQRDRLRTHLRDLDIALAAPALDRARIQELARQIAREAENWRTTWRNTEP